MADPAAIDRSSPLPFYYQLKQILLTDIRQRGLPAGTRLPGDHELCETFGVSRTVVRQALSELETEGVIERVKGRGTFLAAHRTGESLVASLTGLSEDVAARGSTLRSEVHRLEVVPADEHVADELELPLGASVIVLERLRFVDEEPWALVTAYLPYDLVPGLVHEDLSSRSLYAVLEHSYGVTLSRGRRSVEGGVAGTALARSLGLTAGDPILVLRSTVYGPDRPVEMFVAYHRGDRSRFEVNLTRPAATGPREPLMRMRDSAPQR